MPMKNAIENAVKILYDDIAIDNPAVTMFLIEWIY